MPGEDGRVCRPANKHLENRLLTTARRSVSRQVKTRTEVASSLCSANVGSAAKREASVQRNPLGRRCGPAWIAAVGVAGQRHGAHAAPPRVATRAGLDCRRRRRGPKVRQDRGRAV